MLEGQAPSADVFERAAAAALADAKPLSNNGYKIPLAQGLLRQALHRATGVPLPE
jgi:xanthine dehydrogenase YagS FAD-binding subunit